MGPRESTEARGCLRPWPVLARALGLGLALGACTPPAGAGAPVPVPVDPCGVASRAAPGLPLPSELVAAGPLRRVRGSLLLEVWAPAAWPLPETELDRAWGRGCAALRFVQADLGLAAHEASAAGPVRWVLLPDADFAALPGTDGADALTIEAGEGEGDALVSPGGLLGDPAELDDTLAHELVHVVQGRVVPGSEGVPWFVTEGMAVSAGVRHGRARHGRVTGPAEGYLALSLIHI